MAANKYNVRAIRSELDGYIRHTSWKNFRGRFQGLDIELRRAVVEYRPTPNGKGSKKRHSTTLLHALCNCVHATPPVPVDLLQLMVEACPHLLYSHKTSRTPLAIALEHQAPLAILECLLAHDTARRSLYIPDNKTGDTPILQAIKQPATDDVIMLLVAYDPSKQSLLIPSKKRNRVPLFYVASNELSLVHLEVGYEDEIPPELEFMLLHTHAALKIQKGEISEFVEDNGASCDDALQAETAVPNNGLYDDLEAFYDDCQDDDDSLLDAYSYSEPTYSTNLLRATLACAHFLGDKHAIALVNFLLSSIPDFSNSLDEQDNTILHHLCQAQHVFASSALLDCRIMTETIIQCHKSSVTTPNAQGNLPLHLALESKKPWDGVLQPLLDAAPETVSSGNTLTGRLPLHVAISSYQSRSKEIHNTWQLYPEASAIQDPTTRLFPFQLAAVPKDTHRQGQSMLLPSNAKERRSPNDNTRISRNHGLAPTGSPPNQQDLDQLSDIFFLLRASPQTLREFTS